MNDPMLVIIAVALIVAIDTSAWVQACWVASLFTGEDKWTRPLPYYFNIRSLAPRYVTLLCSACLALLAHDSSSSARDGYLIWSCLVLVIYGVLAAWIFYRDLRKHVIERR